MELTLSGWVGEVLCQKIQIINNSNKKNKMKKSKHKLPQSGTKGIKVSYTFKNSKRDFEYTYDFENNDEIIQMAKYLLQSVQLEDEKKISHTAKMIEGLCSLEKGVFNYVKSHYLLSAFSRMIEEGLKLKCENEDLALIGSYFIGLVHLYFNGFKNGINKYELLINERDPSVMLYLTDEMSCILES